MRVSVEDYSIVGLCMEVYFLEFCLFFLVLVGGCKMKGSFVFFI